MKPLLSVKQAGTDIAKDKYVEAILFNEGFTSANNVTLRRYVSGKSVYMRDQNGFIVAGAQLKKLMQEERVYIANLPPSEFMLPACLRNKGIMVDVGWDDAVSDNWAEMIVDGEIYNVLEQGEEAAYDYPIDYYEYARDKFIEDHEEYFKRDSPDIYGKHGEQDKVNEALDDRYELISYSAVDIDWKCMLSKTECPVLVRIHSNYDSMGSHWSENQDGYSYRDSYFGDMLDALFINPATMKKVMEDRGFKTVGAFPSRPYRDGKEAVNLHDLCMEIENTTCGGNLMTFMCTIPLEEYYANCGKRPGRIVVPAGTNYTMFSLFYGGGGALCSVTTRDLVLKPALEYDGYGIRYGKDKYGPMSVYGCGKGIFNNEITIKEWIDDKE